MVLAHLSHQGLLAYPVNDRIITELLRGYCMSLHHLISELPSHRKAHVKQGKIWMVCPDPDHSGGNERTPSCTLTIEGEYQGYYSCFGCGKSGHYNDIAKLYGLEPITDYRSEGQGQVNFKKFAKGKAPKLPDTMFDWNPNKSWRGIPGKTVVKFSGKVFTRKKEDYLFLPVDPDIPEAYIVAMTRDPLRDKNGKKTEQPYDNSPGSWKRETLFGYDLACETSQQGKPLWITEGPRDCMACYSAKYRVVALMGSRLRDTQAELIRFMPNVPYIIQATDNDEPGEKAAESIAEELTHIPQVRYIWSRGDPCEYSLDQLITIRKRLTKRLEETI